MKIGDKVRIKDKFWELGNPINLLINDEKKNLVGKVLEVKYIYSWRH